MDRLEKRLGVIVQTSWGMTELSPLGTTSARNGTRSESLAIGAPADRRRSAAHRMPTVRRCPSNVDTKASCARVGRA